MGKSEMGFVPFEPKKADAKRKKALEEERAKIAEEKKQKEAAEAVLAFQTQKTTPGEGQKTISVELSDIERAEQAEQEDEVKIKPTTAAERQAIIDSTFSDAEAADSSSQAKKRKLKIGGEGTVWENENGEKIEIMKSIGNKTSGEWKVRMRMEGKGIREFDTAKEARDFLEKGGFEKAPAQEKADVFYPPVPTSGKTTEHIDNPEIIEDDGKDKGGEVVDAEFEEVKDEQLENLQKAVEEARKNYAGKDYEVSNKLARIKSILGGHFKFKTNDDQATNTSLNQYKTVLNELLSYQIEKIKSRNLPDDQVGKEIGALAKYFNQDEKINLFEAHTNARTEAVEKKFGKIPGAIMEKTGNFINHYRKLDWKKKMAVGVGLGLTGLGFLAFGQRIVGGAAAGVGVTTGLEAHYRKKENKKSIAEQANIKNNLENITSPEEKYAALMQKMQAEMDGYRDSLRTEKTKARNRKLMGLATGVFLGSGAVSHLMHWGLDETGASHYISEAKKALGFGSVGDVKVAGNKNGIVDKIVATEKPKASQVLGGLDNSAGNNPALDGNVGSAVEAAPDIEISKNIPLTIEKGSSFEGSIIKHLESTGVEHKEAGQMAHRMYLDYIENHPDPTGHGYNIVHPNAQLEIGLDADGKPEILNFEDSPASEWDKVSNIKINADEASEKIAANITPENPIVESTNPEILPEKNIVSSLAEAADNTGSSFNGAGATAGAVGIAGASLGLKNIAKKKEGKVIPFAEAKEAKEKTKEAAKQAKQEMREKNKMRKELEKIAKKYGAEINDDDSFLSRAKGFIKIVSLGSLANWGVMKNVEFSEKDLKEKLSPKLVRNLRKMEKILMDNYGKEFKAKEGETIKKWMARVAEKSRSSQEFVMEKLAA